jgi:integrase
VWEPAVKAAGLDGLNFHDLRRTNATAMVAEDVDVKTAQARLGHGPLAYVGDIRTGDD